MGIARSIDVTIRRTGHLRTRMLRGVAIIVACFSLVPNASAIGPTNAGHLERISKKPAYLQLAHGFHCRPMYGWDPRLGIYHLHRHPGICKDYQRCMKVMYRCDFLHGKGWESWSYERWGFDNWRFDKCMLDAGCY